MYLVIVKVYSYCINLYAVLVVLTAYLKSYQQFECSSKIVCFVFMCIFVYIFIDEFFPFLEVTSTFIHECDRLSLCFAKVTDT